MPSTYTNPLVLYLLIWALVLSLASGTAVYCINTIQPTMGVLTTGLTNLDVLPMLCLIYTCTTLIVLFVPKQLSALDDKLISIADAVTHNKLYMYMLAFFSRQTLGLSLSFAVLLTVYYLMISLYTITTNVDWSYLFATYNLAFVWDADAGPISHTNQT